MKRYDNPLMKISEVKEAGDLIPEVVFTTGMFCILLIGGFMLGMLIRIGGGFFINFKDIPRVCTHSKDTQAIQQQLSDTQGQISDLTNSVDVLLQQSEIIKCK